MMRSVNHTSLDTTHGSWFFQVELFWVCMSASRPLASSYDDAETEMESYQSALPLGKCPAHPFPSHAYSLCRADTTA